jgi:hypothetical protein
MMKKRLSFTFFAILILVGAAGTFWGTQAVQAASSVWNSCPRGQVNCAYPGQCRLYTDSNNDQICDRSQSAPSTAASSTADLIVSDSGITVIAGQDSSNVESITVVSEVTQDTTGNNAGNMNTGEAIALKRSYYFIPIFLVLAVLYTLTWTLAAKKVIKVLTHRKIWNFVLLAAMIVSALLGLFLILNIDFDFNINLPFNMLFWHVESGIALGVIGIFHIIWHWRYFSRLFKAVNKSDNLPA